MKEDLRRRFVVLGASNVSRGFALLASRVRAADESPVEILAAHGRGRSFVATSRYLWTRELVSIDACGLWSVMAARIAPTDALVCDIGNDLAYGVPAAVVASRTERTLERLLERNARTVLVSLPLASLERMSRIRFEIARRLMFPGREIVLETLIDEARALDQRLAQLAAERGVAFVRPEARWFGLDPIHFRLSSRDAAWRAYLAPLGFAHDSGELTLTDRLRLARRGPEFRRFLGVNQHRPQPCVRFDDGTTVSEF